MDDALGILAETLDYVCAERIQPALRWLACNLAQHGKLSHAELLELLETISISTIRRHLVHLGEDLLRLPHRPTRTSSMARDIPMRCIPRRVHARALGG